MAARTVKVAGGQRVDEALIKHLVVVAYEMGFCRAVGTAAGSPPSLEEQEAEDNAVKAHRMLSHVPDGLRDRATKLRSVVEWIREDELRSTGAEPTVDRIAERAEMLRGVGVPLIDRITPDSLASRVRGVVQVLGPRRGWPR